MTDRSTGIERSVAVSREISPAFGCRLGRRTDYAAVAATVLNARETGLQVYVCRDSDADAEALDLARQLGAEVVVPDVENVDPRTVIARRARRQNSSGVIWRSNVDSRSTWTPAGRRSTTAIPTSSMSTQCRLSTPPHRCWLRFPRTTRPTPSGKLKQVQ